MSNSLRPYPAAKQIVSSNEGSLLRTEGDFNLINQLLKSPRYNIPEHLRQKVVSCIEKALDDSENSTKLKLDAIKTLSNLEKHNIDLVKLAMPKKIETFNPKQLNDEELREMVQDVLKLLPIPIHEVDWKEGD